MQHSFDFLVVVSGAVLPPPLLIAGAYATTKDIRAAVWRLTSRDTSRAVYTYKGVEWTVFRTCGARMKGCQERRINNCAGPGSCLGWASSYGDCSGEAECTIRMMAFNLRSCDMP